METGRAVLALGYVQGVAKKCSFPERIGKRTGFLDAELKTTLSEPFNVSPRSLRLPHTREAEIRVEGGGGETSYFPLRLFLYKGAWTDSTALRACQPLFGGSCGPARLSFALVPRGSPRP